MELEPFTKEQDMKSVFARRTAYNIHQAVERLERKQAQLRQQVAELEQIGDESPAGKRRMTIARKTLRIVDRDLEDARNAKPYLFKNA